MNLDTFEGLDRRLDRSSLVLITIGIPAAFFLYSAKAALSVGVGALLSYVNFRWLKQAVDFLVNTPDRSPRRVLAQFVGRYALIAVVLYVTIRGSLLELVFVFAGLLVYVGAILIECVSEVVRVLVRDFRNGRT